MKKSALRPLTVLLAVVLACFVAPPSRGQVDHPPLLSARRAPSSAGYLP
jgi:hypothetical protein